MRPQPEKLKSLKEYMLGDTSEDIAREDMFGLESSLEKMEAYGPKREPTSVFSQHGLSAASSRPETRGIFQQLSERYESLVDNDVLTLKDLNALAQVLRPPERNHDGSTFKTTRVLVSDNPVVHRILGEELGSMDPKDMSQLNVGVMTYDQVVQEQGIPLSDESRERITQESQTFREQNQHKVDYGYKLLDSGSVEGQRQQVDKSKSKQKFRVKSPFSKKKTPKDRQR